MAFEEEPGLPVGTSLQVVPEIGGGIGRQGACQLVQFLEDGQHAGSLGGRLVQAAQGVEDRGKGFVAWHGFGGFREHEGAWESSGGPRYFHVHEVNWYGSGVRHGCHQTTAWAVRSALSLPSRTWICSR